MGCKLKQVVLNVYSKHFFATLPLILHKLVHHPKTRVGHLAIYTCKGQVMAKVCIALDDLDGDLFDFYLN